MVVREYIYLYIFWALIKFTQKAVCTNENELMRGEARWSCDFHGKLPFSLVRLLTLSPLPDSRYHQRRILWTKKINKKSLEFEYYRNRTETRRANMCVTFNGNNKKKRKKRKKSLRFASLSRAHNITIDMLYASHGRMAKANKRTPWRLKIFSNW